MAATEREYAEALFNLAKDENKVQEISFALNTVKCVVEENNEYIELLSCPAIPLNERLGCIDAAFGTLPKYVVSFLKVLCENGRAKLLLACIDEFMALAFAFLGIAEAQIYSVVELSDEQKQKLINKLESLTGKKVNASYFTDKSLIGGMRIEVDGKCYDASLKHRLNEIKEVISK